MTLNPLHTSLPTISKVFPLLSFVLLLDEVIGIPYSLNIHSMFNVGSIESHLPISLIAAKLILYDDAPLSSHNAGINCEILRSVEHQALFRSSE